MRIQSQSLEAQQSHANLGQFPDVEKLEFQPRSQFRRPPAALMQNSLGIRRTDRVCGQRRSRMPYRKDYPLK
jgi:hypothetical protein